MSKECANCGNERIMLCPFCEHDYTDQSTLTALRLALDTFAREVGIYRPWLATWQPKLGEDERRNTDANALCVEALERVKKETT